MSGKISVHERDFLLALRAEGMPEPMREYRFAPPRRFRFDFAWPLWRGLVERCAR